MRHGFGVFKAPMAVSTYTGHWIDGKRDG